MKARMVVFHIDYQPNDSGLALDEALLAAFSFVPTGVVLRASRTSEEASQQRTSEVDEKFARKGLLYVSGNYDEAAIGERALWTGDLIVSRSGKKTDFNFDVAHGVRIGTGDYTSIEKDKTSYLIDTDAGILVFWERADLPYTRLVSYIAKAQEYHRKEFASNNFNIALWPVTEAAGIDNLFKLFRSVTKVTVEFTHAQSPGRISVDEMLDALGAEVMKETATAPEGKGLNKEALLSQDADAASIAQAIDHIRRNPDNGTVEVSGVMQDETFTTLNSAEPVRREMVTIVGDTRRDFVTAAYSLIKRARTSLLGVQVQAQTDTDEEGL